MLWEPLRIRHRDTTVGCARRIKRRNDLGLFRPGGSTLFAQATREAVERPDQQYNRQKADDNVNAPLHFNSSGYTNLELCRTRGPNG
jgi:hypothetical protein